MTLKDNIGSSSNKTNTNNEYMRYDELDLKLADLLLRGSDFSTMSRETNIPLSTIHRRVKKILDAYFLNEKKELDYNKCEMKKAYLSINVKGKRSPQCVAEDISKIKGVISICFTIGNYDLVCIVIYNDNEELLDIFSSIKKNKNINQILFAEEISQYPINTNNQL